MHEKIDYSDIHGEIYSDVVIIRKSRFDRLTMTLCHPELVEGLDSLLGRVAEETGSSPE